MTFVTKNLIEENKKEEAIKMMNLKNDSYFLELSKKEFEYHIKNRGRNYYKDGHVECFKSNGVYFANVMGSYEEKYKVFIQIIEDGNVAFSCTCPCDFNCKHEYATLLSIINKDYKEVKLKPYINQNNYSLEKLINLMPEKELKLFLIDNIDSGEIFITQKDLENYFYKYLPKQDYEYYYNNLYNAIVLNDNYTIIFNTYLDQVKKYISILEFDESFIIIKSIIEAYKDSSIINKDNHIIEKFPYIGLALRVIYRKSDNQTKLEINEWISKLELDNYYNNLYLEDIVLSI